MFIFEYRSLCCQTRAFISCNGEMHVRIVCFLKKVQTNTIKKCFHGNIFLHNIQVCIFELHYVWEQTFQLLKVEYLDGL